MGSDRIFMKTSDEKTPLDSGPHGSIIVVVNALLGFTSIITQQLFILRIGT